MARRYYIGYTDIATGTETVLQYDGSFRDLVNWIFDYKRSHDVDDDMWIASITI